MELNINPYVLACLVEALKEVDLPIQLAQHLRQQLNPKVLSLVKVRLVAMVLKVLKTVEKVTVVAAAACMVAWHPKIRVILLIVRVAVAVVMSIQTFLLIMKQLPVINPSCHLRAY